MNGEENAKAESPNPPADSPTPPPIALENEAVLPDAHEEPGQQTVNVTLNVPQTETRPVEWLQVIVNGALAIIGVFAIVIYNGELTVMKGQLNEMQKQYPELVKSAGAADRASNTASRTLELSERPWVDAKITINGSLTFNVNGARIPLNIALRNTGHSPALATTIIPYPAVGSESIDAVKIRDQRCKNAVDIALTWPKSGISLFPNVEYPAQEYDVVVSNQDIERGKEHNFPGVIMNPSVIVCIAYRPTFNQKSVYQTIYIEDIFKSINPSNQFPIGQSIPQQYLMLVLHLEGGGITAN